MRSRILFILAALTFTIAAKAQVKVGGASPTPNADAILELESTSKGMILPRVALTNTTSFAPLSAHVQGMTVYNTATAGDVTPGIYVNDGTKWLRAGSSTASNPNVTVVTTTPYTLLADDDVLVTNLGQVNTINLPTLTLADEGRTVSVVNDNTGAFQTSIVASPVVLNYGATLNQYRARTFVWTGTKWLTINP